jgi:hypothetical protein
MTTEVDALLFHNEGEDIAAGVAAEAVPALLLGVNIEGGMLFTVEGAESAEGAARFGQGDMLADDVNDVQFLFDVVDNAHIMILFYYSWG